MVPATGISGESPSQRTERISALFKEALDVPVARRARFLEGKCVGDPGLRAEVASLLASHASAPDYLGRLADELLPVAFRGFVRSPVVALEPGERVAHYEIVERIGSGGMGVVYRARDIRLQRAVALKFLPRQATAQSPARERMTYEARAASALDHPNICTIYDIGELDDGRVYLALACYEGETLQRKIARGLLPPMEAAAICRQVVSGLAAAHRGGIIHCDIKPANIMVTPEGLVKILDFGIARMRSPHIDAGRQRAGTKGYMSPEQVRGGSIDARTDIWSVGVLLYEMLTGRRPFDAAGAGIMNDSDLTADLTPVDQLQPEVPAVLARIADRCLAVDPAARYQRADELAADLESFETGAGEEVAGLHLRRIAVMPLATSDLHPEAADLAKGIAGELIVRLSLLRGLRLTAVSSAARLSSGTLSAVEVGRQLGVDLLLEGVASQANDAMRIELRLTDVARSTQLWTTRQEVVPTELQGALRAAAWQIAGELDVQMQADERRQLASQGTGDAQAYAQYLKGRYFWHKRARVDVERAREHFQEALDRDPLFAQAWSGLADSLLVLGSYAVLPADEAWPRARAAAERALSIEPDLAEAHVSLATALADHYADWESASVHYRRALELNPSYATARLWYAGYLRDLGLFEEALEQVRMARELDPLSAPTHASEGITLYVARRYDEALDVYERLRSITPEFGYVHFLRALALVQLGEHTDALVALREVADWGAGAPDVLGLTGYIHGAGGRETEARRALGQLQNDSSRPGGNHFQCAIVHLGLQDHESALDLLRSAIGSRAKNIRLLRVEPLFDRLRRDRRFGELLLAAGLSDEAVRAAAARIDAQSRGDVTDIRVRSSRPTP